MKANVLSEKYRIKVDSVAVATYKRDIACPCPCCFVWLFGGIISLSFFHLGVSPGTKNPCNSSTVCRFPAAMRAVICGYQGEDRVGFCSTSCAIATSLGCIVWSACNKSGLYCNPPLMNLRLLLFLAISLIWMFGFLHHHVGASQQC